MCGKIVKMYLPAILIDEIAFFIYNKTTLSLFPFLLMVIYTNYYSETNNKLASFSSYKISPVCRY